MDQQRFDDLTRALAAVSRRNVIKGIVGAIAGGIGLAARDAGATRVCRELDDSCGNAGQCCSGVCSPTNSNGRRRCVCGSPADCPQPTDQCAQATCVVGVCGVAPAVDRACTDGDACTVGDACNAQGVCVGTPLDCSSLTTQCTTGVCSAGSCVAQPNTGQACDDGDACTGNDVCTAAGTCAGSPIEVGLTCPNNVDVNTAAGTCGAVVHFVPTATCATSLSCDYADNATFPLGTTTVTCSAGNAVSGTQCSFTVTVNDGEGPSITCPSDITVAVVDATSTTVSFAVGATDNCGQPTLRCDHPSGSSFDAGTTSVSCIAEDASGGQSSCSFNVTVNACQRGCLGGCGSPDGCGGFCGGSCPDQTSDECSSSSGACVPSVGCVYNQLPAGAACGHGDACAPTRCSAAGVCEAHPVACDSECGVCNPATGACIARPDQDRKVCGAGDMICENGVCQSPCGACSGVCTIRTDINTGNETFMCCPAEYVGSNGLCCWVKDSFGVVIDGICHDPALVCRNNVICGTECCGRNHSQSGTGTCCGTSAYCLGDACAPQVNVSCTTDGACSSVYPSGVCANGSCCPGQQAIVTDVTADGPIYTCCGPASLPVFTSSTAQCCAYPGYESGCFDCQCSFGSIRRCCF